MCDRIGFNNIGHDHIGFYVVSNELFYQNIRTMVEHAMDFA